MSAPTKASSVTSALECDRSMLTLCHWHHSYLDFTVTDKIKTFSSTSSFTTSRACGDLLVICYCALSDRPGSGLAAFPPFCVMVVTLAGLLSGHRQRLNDTEGGDVCTDKRLISSQPGGSKRLSSVLVKCGVHFLLLILRKTFSCVVIFTISPKMSDTLRSFFPSRLIAPVIRLHLQVQPFLLALNEWMRWGWAEHAPVRRKTHKPLAWQLACIISSNFIFSL